MERLKSSLMKFYGSYGDLIKYYEVSLSQMLNGILGHDHIQWHPQSIRHYTNLWTYYRTWPYYRFWPYYQISRGFHGTLQRVLLANRGRLLLRTPGPVPFGTCICSNVETIDNFFPELVMSTEPLSFEQFQHPSVLLFCFVDLNDKHFRKLLWITKDDINIKFILMYDKRTNTGENNILVYKDKHFFT